MPALASAILCNLGQIYSPCAIFSPFIHLQYTPSLHSSRHAYNDNMVLTHKKLRKIFYFTDFSPFLWLSSCIKSPTELIIITTPQALGEAQKRWKKFLVIKKIYLKHL